jgi:hypothetical protein
LQGSQSAKSEPQCAWEYFLLASSVPEAPIGGTSLCSEMVSTSPTEVGVERSSSERHMLGAAPSQEKTPQRMQRPRKDKGKREEDHLLAELSVHPAAKESMMLSN